MGHTEISILCLIGLPASGKTYLASLIAKHKLGFNEIILFCYDDLIRWDKDKFVWKEERNNVLKNVENKILVFLDKKRSNEKMLVILDDNMYYHSMRFAFYKLAKKYKIKYCQVFVDTSLITCLIRNSKRTPSLPTYQILNINEKFEVPFYYNGWEKNTLTVNGEENIRKYIDKIRQLIEMADVPTELDVQTTKEQSKLQNLQNPKHIADLALRKIISLLVKEMKEGGEHNIIEKILKLNKRKREVIKLIDNDEFYLPCYQDIEIYIQHLLPIMVIQKEESVITTSIENGFIL